MACNFKTPLAPASIVRPKWDTMIVKSIAKIERPKWEMWEVTVKANAKLNYKWIASSRCYLNVTYLILTSSYWDTLYFWNYLKARSTSDPFLLLGDVASEPSLSCTLSSTGVSWSSEFDRNKGMLLDGQDKARLY